MGRLRGCIWLSAGLIVALLAGFVGFMTLQRAEVQRSGQPAAAPEVSAVVVARAVPVRTILKAEDLALKNLPVSAVPEGALRSVNEAVGKVTLADLYAGELVLTQRLTDPKAISGDGRMALIMSQDQVLMAFPAQDLMTKAGVLKPGDHVDLFFSLKFPAGRGLPGGATTSNNGSGAQQSEELGTFDLLQNVSISAMVGGNADAQNGKGGNAGPVDGLLLVLSPQDALVLKYMKDAGGTLDVVLRAPGAEQPFQTEPVDLDYLINRYRIPAAPGK